CPGATSAHASAPSSAPNVRASPRLTPRRRPPRPMSGRHLGSRLGAVLREKVARLVRVDRDARAHRRREGGLLYVATLRRRRLQPEHLIDGSGVVLDQLLRAEG